MKNALADQRRPQVPSYDCYGNVESRECRSQDAFSYSERVCFRFGSHVVAEKHFDLGASYALESNADFQSHVERLSVQELIHPRKCLIAAMIPHQHMALKAKIKR